ncbi:UNVERIFIED_CONTAM: hypothetical protein FKN15_019003 [Acipenser sinensis]
MEEDLTGEELLLQKDEEDDLKKPQPSTSTAGVVARAGSSNCIFLKAGVLGTLAAEVALALGTPGVVALAVAMLTSVRVTPAVALALETGSVDDLQPIVRDFAAALRSKLKNQLPWLPTRGQVGPEQRQPSQTPALAPSVLSRGSRARPLRWLRSLPPDSSPTAPT